MSFSIWYVITFLRFLLGNGDPIPNPHQQCLYKQNTLNTIQTPTTPCHTRDRGAEVTRSLDNRMVIS